MPGPCEFSGAGLAHLQEVHSGPVSWAEMACLHGHAEAGWACAWHLEEAMDRVSRAGAVRCGRCGHVCGVVLRVPSTGAVAGTIGWP